MRKRKRKLDHIYFIGAIINSVELITPVNVENKGWHWIVRLPTGEERLVRQANINRIVIKKPIDSNSPLNILYKAYRLGAKSRDYEFTITKEFVSQITKQNCHYCAEEPKQIQYTKARKKQLVYNGIDRRNNTLGYTPENCVPCCYDCNRIKGDILTEDEALCVIKSLMAFRKSQQNTDLYK